MIRIPPIAVLSLGNQNSGTSYTNLLVKRVTGQHIATNYGGESEGNAVFPTSPDGPFWVESSDMSRYQKPHSGYLITKTHCGSRCNRCLPEKYILSGPQFLNKCFETTPVQKKTNQSKTYYERDRVHRAIHIIRDPFDNAVARYHLALKGVNTTINATTSLPKSREGFRAFCDELGERFLDVEKNVSIFQSIFHVMKDIPCR